MDDRMVEAAFRIGRFFVSDIYAYYQDTYKGILGKVQVEALDYLHIKGSASITELATRLNISKQHASKIASKLEEIGYAEKKPDPSDGRACFYHLTEAGIRFISEHISQSNKRMETYINKLSKSEQQSLLDALLQAADILDRSIENG